MDPLTLSLIGGGVQLASGVIGYLVEQGRIDEANKILEAAKDEFGRVNPAKFETVAESVLGPSEFAKIKTDQRLTEGQYDTLNRYGQIIEGGGFGAEDRAALNRGLNAAAQQTQATEAALRDQMAARGIGGSGAELAMRLQAQQAGADSANQTGLDAAAMAQRRYFDTLRARAGLAGQMRGQEFDEKSRVAAAQDAVSRYNHDFNFRRQQYNNQLRGQQFDQELGLAQARYGTARDRANVKMGQGAREAQAIGGFGQGVNQGVQGYSQYSQNLNRPDTAQQRSNLRQRPPDSYAGAGDFNYDEEDPYRYG